LPENLIESELFGHRKGAYTGADDHRVGLFEVAHGGTIFLDEIGELPKSLQATLLRVLESGEIRRLGDNESFEVDVRVLCATHCALEDMVSEGSFRQDLMFRINTFEIVLPALRDRAADIPEIAKHLYHRFHAGGNSAQNLFTPEALNYLQSHHWPGNVRELANAIEHATILCEQLPITVDHLPQRFNQAEVRIDQPGQRSAMTLQELEMEAIHEALGRHDGNKPAVAEELGISLKTLYNKINQSAKLDKSA
jgi:two-component system NtrC family response regulator